MAKNPYINIYGGEVTAGGKDGIPISCDGSFSFPISAFFDIEKPDYNFEDLGVKFKVFKFAIRTEEGFNTGSFSDTTRTMVRVTDYNDIINEKLRLSWYPFVNRSDVSSSTNWDWYISKIYGEIKETNTLFYLRVGYNDGDDLSSYRNTKFNVEAKIFPI